MIAVGATLHICSKGDVSDSRWLSDLPPRQARMPGLWYHRCHRQTFDGFASARYSTHTFGITDTIGRRSMTLLPLRIQHKLFYVSMTLHIIVDDGHLALRASTLVDPPDQHIPWYMMISCLVCTAAPFLCISKIKSLSCRCADAIKKKGLGGVQ